jgi:competence protein ComEA
MQEIKLKILCAAAIFAVTMTFACGCAKQDVSVSTFSDDGKTSESNDQIDTQDKDQTKSEENSENVNGEKAGDVKTDYVYVYVCGAVQHEGVYKMSPDARKSDALDMAGGYLEDAAHGYVNLADSLTDGEKIYIPFESEVTDSVVAYDSQITSESGENGDKSGDGSGNGDVNSGKDGTSQVNINTADKNQLTSLPGIGESKAERILEYRQIHGRFSSTEELMNVSGIGSGVYEKIKEYIKV